MSDDNPYSAPAANFNWTIDPSSLPKATSVGGVWREGQFLVFEQGAQLPQRCIKCNTAHDVKMRKRTLFYYPLWTLLLLLVNIFIFAFAAMLARTSAKTVIGVCPACWQRKQNAALLSWGLVVATIVFFVAAGILPASIYPDAMDLVAIPLLLCGAGCLIAAFVIGRTKARLFIVKNIDKKQVRLMRVDESFLSMLPEGP